MGDLNSGAKDWGYDIEDYRGYAITLFIMENNLYLLNNHGTEPSFVSAGRKGNPDLSITTPGLVHLISNWKILDTESNSDNKFISFDLGDDQSTNSEFYF